MANEATLQFETEVPIPMTCADGFGIEKGALLKLVDPMTISGTNLSGGYVAGVCAEEKIASDGKTKLPVYRKGIFKMLLGNSATAGQALILSGSNVVQLADSTHTSGVILGTALETGATGETILVELNPGCNTN